MTDVIRIDGIFYDSKKLAAVHPGGDIFVLMNNNKDGTTLFNSSHRRPFPHSKYESYRVPASSVPADKFEPAPTQDFTLYYEIAEKIKPLLPNNGFAPNHYFVKVGLLLTLYLVAEVYFLFFGRTLGLSIASGTVAAFIGLNIQHDANHGSVSRDPKVNRVLGLSQDLIGGSALAWMINHDTIHHVNCNDIDRDHDLAMPLLRMHTRIPWQVTYTMQQVYLWFLESLFGVVHVFTTAIWTLQGPNRDQKVLAEHWQTHRLMLYANMIRISLNLLMWPSWNTVAMMAVWYMAGGLYLAFFFVISHNFQGVKKEGINSAAGCFVRNQVETSSNVGGWLLVQLNGGLNYQIEHHLFPRVHHSNYPRIAPVVRSICEKHGIQYVHFPNIWDNVASTFEHLRVLGSKPL
jgi:fatty acid desaturase (delta-4 desaturase)